MCLCVWVLHLPSYLYVSSVYLYNISYKEYRYRSIIYWCMNKNCWEKKTWKVCYSQLPTKSNIYPSVFLIISTFSMGIYPSSVPQAIQHLQYSTIYLYRLRFCNIHGIDATHYMCVCLICVWFSYRDSRARVQVRVGLHEFIRVCLIQ